MPIILTLGLCGEEPATVDIAGVAAVLSRVGEQKTLALLSRQPVRFDPAVDLVFRQRERQSLHTNAMAFSAFGAKGELLGRRLRDR